MKYGMEMRSFLTHFLSKTQAFMRLRYRRVMFFVAVIGLQTGKPFNTSQFSNHSSSLLLKLAFLIWSQSPTTSESYIPIVKARRKTRRDRAASFSSNSNYNTASGDGEEESSCPLQRKKSRQEDNQQKRQ